jgi:hypothetical protein
MGNDCFFAPMRFLNKKTAGSVGLLLGLPLCLLGQAGGSTTPPATPSASARLRSHFESDVLSSPPGFFDFLVLGAPGEAEWRVTADRNPFSPPNFLMQTAAGRPDGSIAAAIRRNAVFRDGTVSVALRQGPGRGGIVFRFAGEKDFRCLLVNLASGEARLTAFEKGKAAELTRGRALLQNSWAVLSVTVQGAKISARWDGKPLLEATDPHPEAGRAGMATAGPGLVAFDEFIVEIGDCRLKIGLRNPSQIINRQSSVFNPPSIVNHQSSIFNF